MCYVSMRGCVYIFCIVLGINAYTPGHNIAYTRTRAHAYMQSYFYAMLLSFPCVCADRGNPEGSKGCPDRYGA